MCLLDEERFNTSAKWLPWYLIVEFEHVTSRPICPLKMACRYDTNIIMICTNRNHKPDIRPKRNTSDARARALGGLQAFGLESPIESEHVDSVFVLNEKKRWKVQKLLLMIEEKLPDWPKAAELSCQMLTKLIRLGE